jgi:hypothetical protein
MQDEEDAKGGMYNWFAQSQRLLTPFRMLLATFFTVAAACFLLRWQLAVVVLVVCITITVAAKAYSAQILGGVVGDFLGASIAVAEIAIYLALSIDWQVTRLFVPHSHMCHHTQFVLPNKMESIVFPAYEEHHALLVVSETLQTGFCAARKCDG